MAKSKRPGYKKKVFLLVGSAMLTLLLVEGAMQLLAATGTFADFFVALGDPTPPLDIKTGHGLYYVHPYTSYAMKPGYHNKRVNINSLGLRGEEITRHKPPNVYRVVCVGGSTTFGIYVKDAHTYPLLLEGELRQRLDSDQIQVVNSGLVCGTSAESLHRMFTEILPLDPDMIVIYHGINDVVPRVFNGFSDDYYHFRKVDPYRRSLASRSYLYRLTLRKLFPIKFHENYNMVRYVWKFENLPSDVEQKFANFEQTSAAAFEQNLDYIITLARARGVKVVIATFAIDENLSNWMDYLPAELWPRGVADNNQAVRRLAERHNLPLIDFYDYALTDRAIFEDSIHMTEDGNKKKAAFFAETISPMIAEQLRP